MCAGNSAYRARRATSAWSIEARKSLDNPFGARVSPMSQVHVLGTWCYLCVRAQIGDLGIAGGPRPTMMSTMSAPYHSAGIAVFVVS